MISLWDILPKPYSDIILQVLQEVTFNKKRLEHILQAKFRDFKKRELNVHNILKFLEFIGGKVVKDGKTYEVLLDPIYLDVKYVEGKIIMISDLHSTATDFNSLRKIIKKNVDKKYGKPTVLAAGDLTISGKSSEFRIIRNYLDYFIWGNHDLCRGTELLKYHEGNLGRMIGCVRTENYLIILFHDYLWYIFNRPKLVEIQADEKAILFFGHPHYGLFFVGNSLVPFYRKGNLLIIPSGAMTIHGNYKRYTIDYTVIDGNCIEKVVLRKSHGKGRKRYTTSF